MTPTGLFIQIDKHLWETSRAVNLLTRYGPLHIPQRTRTDLFSLVPNTEHEEFRIAALEHDYARKNRKVLGWTRHMTDLVFRDEMILQSYKVYQRLLDEGKPETEALEELWSLLKRSAVYYRGVAGVIGTVYMFFTEHF